MKILFKPFGNCEKEKRILQGIVKVMGVSGQTGKAGQTELMEKLAVCDILLGDIEVNVTKELLEHTGRLCAIVCRSIGVDFVDIPAATEKGILVLNSPEFCVVAVAEFTIGLMLSLLRRIPAGNSAVFQGQWEARGSFRGMEVYGKTMGIIGYGKIGREVAVRAKGLGMGALAYDPYLNPSDMKNSGVYPVSLDQLLKESDIVTVHMPLNASTKGLIGKKELSSMKDGSYILNVSRGGIVDETALCFALKNSKLAGAALDVLTEEPPDEHNELLKIESGKLLITPHIAWNTAEASKKNGEVFIGQISSLARNEVPSYVINKEAIPTWLKKYSE